MCVFCGHECCVCKRCDVCLTVLSLCMCTEGDLTCDADSDFDLAPAPWDPDDVECESCQ